MLLAGADKVSVNSAAVMHPEIILKVLNASAISVSILSIDG